MSIGPDALTELTAEIVGAIGEALVRVSEGDRGDDLVDLLARVRELHVALLEMLLEAEPNVDEQTRELIAALGYRIDEIQATLQAERGER